MISALNNLCDVVDVPEMGGVLQSCSSRSIVFCWVFKESFWRVVQTRWMWSHWLKTCCGEQDHVFFPSREVALQVLTCCVFGARVWLTKRKSERSAAKVHFTSEEQPGLIWAKLPRTFTLVHSRTLMFVFFGYKHLQYDSMTSRLKSSQRRLNKVKVCVWISR